MSDLSKVFVESTDCVVKTSTELPIDGGATCFELVYPIPYILEVAIAVVQVLYTNGT